MTESLPDRLKQPAVSGKRNLLVGIIILLVILLALSSSIAFYYASSPKPSHNDSNIQETVVLDNQSVVGTSGGMPAYVFAGTFSAPQPGYLVVTGTSFPVSYSIALQIVMNATRPDNYVPLSNGTEQPYYNIRPNSANSTLITVPFKNDFALLPVLRGNVSVYVYTPSGDNVGAVLNATYYY